ncbi:unnamed protein product [Blepharisma stoltei]|uniref:Uncharacterized protein n=1 Tax=Blepharisma stoltei TaxID=1481888 RepID=A0AAU9J7L3_9CILI|nr:unnamed protein product [Blepharisma stoltei]
MKSLDSYNFGPPPLFHQNQMASSFTPEEEETIQFLMDKLRNIRNSIKFYYEGPSFKPAQIPAPVKEEIVSLFDQHGGIDILVKLTHISPFQIKMWHKEWKKDPSCFYANRDPGSFKHFKKSDFVGKVLGEKDAWDDLKLNKDKKMPKLKREDYRGITSLEQIRNKLSPEVQAECEQINKLMKERKSEVSGIDPEIKRMIVKAVLKAGNPKPIGLMIGVNERIILSWRAVFVKELEENGADYKKEEDAEEKTIAKTEEKLLM